MPRYILTVSICQSQRKKSRKMDDYVTRTDTPLRAKPFNFADILFTLPAGLGVESDEALVSEGVLWRYCHRKSVGRGWIRSDLIERYVPASIVVTDRPIDAAYSLAYAAGWNACLDYFVTVAEKAKQAE
jgi:hypothetical protein